MRYEIWSEMKVTSKHPDGLPVWCLLVTDEDELESLSAHKYYSSALIDGGFTPCYTGHGKNLTMYWEFGEAYKSIAVD